MNFTYAEQIANAVLYEGYILYPYRPSSVKNRQRWTFGGIYPQAYSQTQGETDAWWMQTECPVLGNLLTTLAIKVRFLHLLWREIGELTQPVAGMPDPVPLSYRSVPSLAVGDQVFHTWQEAVEREVTLANLNLDDLVRQPQCYDFAFPASQQTELLRPPNGAIAGVIVRQQQAIAGTIEIAAEKVDDQQLGGQLFKLAVRILNHTPFAAVDPANRDAALMHAFISTHTLLSVQNGEFISLLEPAPAYSASAAACCNRGTYPVLVGEAGQRDLMLSSPIILYDYPQIAPESAGDLFDGTEIDEILTLRILAMTDAEKQEMRQVDERARALLERTETLSGEQLMKLHGMVRNLRPLEGKL